MEVGGEGDYYRKVSCSKEGTRSFLNSLMRASGAGIKKGGSFIP